MGLTPDAHRDRFAGRDVYVVGSGPSLLHIPPEFWDGRCIVSANHGVTHLNIRPTYLLTKYHQHAHSYRTTDPGVPVVVTRHNRGDGEQITDDEGLIVIDHNRNPSASFDEGSLPWEMGTFVASWSTITTAMEWAAWLGASNIILAGHDCGWIDEAPRIPGYRDSALEPGYQPGDAADAGYWQGFDMQTRIVKPYLLQKYEGVKSVVSLLPFVNANMEGHRWRSHAGVLNA